MPVTASNITFSVPAFRSEKKASWVTSTAGFLTKGATAADDHYLRTAARPLMLLHPRPASEISGFTSLWNRWVTNAPWKAYPSAIGGSWPYIWELIGAPSGMTIANPTHTNNSTYELRAGHGRITWPSPTAGTHTFRIRCTDQEGAVVVRSVTLDVNDTWGIWVDDTLGTDSTAAAGTAAAPFKRIANFYGGAGGSSAAILNMARHRNRKHLRQR